MRSLEELKEMLCEELDKIVDKGTISMSDLEIVHKLVDTIKNIHKIEMDGSSYSGGSYADGSYTGGSYGNYSGDDWSGNGSYGRSYGRSSRGRNYSRGRYSYDDGMVTERIERMMTEGGLNAQEKDTLRRAMEILKK